MTIHTNYLSNKPFNPRKLKWRDFMNGNTHKTRTNNTWKTLDIFPKTKP